MPRRTPLPLPMLLLLLLAAAPAARAQDVGGAVRAIAESGELDGLRWPRFPDEVPILTALYEPRGWAPLWLDDGKPTAQASEAIGVLRGCDVHGLEPRDYDAERLDTEARDLADHRSAVPDAQARFDVALSVAIVRHLDDVHMGRVDPHDLHFGYDVRSKQLDLAQVIGDAVRDGRIAAAIDEARPQVPQLHLLEEHLARQRDIAADPLASPPTIELGRGRKKIAPGDPIPDPERTALAVWLVAQGDLPRDAVLMPLYDGPLVDAVRHFQARHGLDPDGVIGASTAQALAVPAAVRAHQIELALERLRWLPDVAGGRVVFVNVPGFELRAFDRVGPDTVPALDMKVVVGRAVRTETPIFSGVMKRVVFAPYWHVPRTIIVKEILPKLAKNPGYLDGEDMEIVVGHDAVATDAASIAALAAGSARLRQRPGPKNSLGRVKFLFPNGHDVYLHDTPARTLFQRPRRDFSHGCIRVEQPELLARWVLGPEGWNDDAVAAGLALATETPVPLAHPFLVVVYYTTALARRDGTISFYQDIYGHDAELDRALADTASYRR